MVSLKNVNKIYQTGEVSFQALKNINLEVKIGDFLAIIGASGSGKSTMMNIIGLLDHPTSGSYILDMQDTSHLSQDNLAALRNKKIGFIFQSFNLLPRTAALEQVALPLIYAGVPKLERANRAREILEQVDLGEKLNSNPNQLSGGQQQRVAIARSLINNPQIILADEPTGNLDTKSGMEIMKIFNNLHSEGKTIIMITHEENIAQHAKRRIRIKDGEITG
ncbi:ABC transporter ATP-binding protein [Candidatus Daviesbacteria bacterium]|nr:ABC transporter ATP-binding protein [Candidatus Daviesbacteria bacterium]